MDDSILKSAIPIFGLVFLVVILIVASVWKVFTKAGKPGWGCIVPIYNVILLLEIAGKPLWWLILLFIPFVSIVIAVLVSIEVAKAFGKSSGFGVGLALLPFVFYPMLGFGSAQFQGPKAS